MSDDEIDSAMPSAPMDEFERELYAEDEDGEEEETAKKTKVAQQKYADEDEEDEEEQGDYDDDDEDDEEEEEEEEEGSGRPKKKTKHRHKRPAVNRFLDLEVEVDSDEDEEEDDEEYGRDEFIAEPGLEGDDDEELGRRAAGHARLDRRERELDDQDLAKIAQDLKQRYGRATVRYTGDMNEVPQRLLMPSVHDASLWQVRVKPGRERDLVFSLMRKAVDLEYTARPIAILSAFQRDTLPGMIYVEARSSQQVSQACQGLVGIYPSRGITLVPIEEMASLLQIKKQEFNIVVGGWVRFKRGKYAGDLAQILQGRGPTDDIGLKYVPRIDLNPRDEGGLDGKKRKKIGTGTTMRPPQNLFNYEEVVKVYGRKSVVKRGRQFVFAGDTFKDGFMERDHKISSMQFDEINPTLDEIAQFTRTQDGETEGFDLSAIAEASRKSAVLVLQPGDHVEVFEGEQAGVHGVVDSISQDVVTLTAIGMDLEGQKVDVPARSVRKKFKAGDHVKVMTGQNADETGLVVNVADNIVTFLSDMSMNEVSVFSKDLREAAEVGSGTNTVGNYELHDLVQLDLQTVGVIFKTERDSFRVLDQNGQVRLVQPHQISMRRDSHRATATDSEGHELRVNDNMKEVDGEGRKGIVLHIHQSFFAFLHNRDILENGGIFVTRARSLVSLAPKGNLVKTPMDLTKMNPAMAAPTGGMVGSGNMGRGPRDRLIGATIIIVKGPHKGYAGAVKDTNGPVARIELLAGNKVITVDKDKLRIKGLDGKLIKVEDYGGGQRAGGPRGGAFGNSAPKTPAWSGNNSKTPNPYATEGRTPAWNAASRTPNPYAADGGKTPAWNASSRTPNPYAADGGRTPAWNTSSRTPNPYASGNASGNAGGWGGATPKPTSSWGDGGSWGGSSPQWNQTYNAPTPAASMPTPAAAPTPAALWSSGSPWANVPTPAAHPGWDNYASVATPAFGAPTPGASAGYDNYGRVKFVPPELWLLDPAFKAKNVIVQIGRSTSSAVWQNGEQNDRQGYVWSVFDPRNESATRTAQFVPLEAGDDTSKAITVPIEFLSPVHPDSTNETAVVLDGPQKGVDVILRETASGTKWTVGAYQDPALGFFDVEPDRMVKAHRIRR